MQFSVDGGGVMAEIGEIELHPKTCKVVNLKSSSALSTTLEPYSKNLKPYLVKIPNYPKLR